MPWQEMNRGRLHAARLRGEAPGSRSRGRPHFCESYLQGLLTVKVRATFSHSMWREGETALCNVVNKLRLQNEPTQPGPACRADRA